MTRASRITGAGMKVGVETVESHNMCAVGAVLQWQFQILPLEESGV